MTEDLSRTNTDYLAIDDADSESVEVLRAQLTAARDKIANLKIAVASSRVTSAAVGIVMANRKCSYDEAFDALRIERQRTHRKLREIADEVLLTGTLS